MRIGLHRSKGFISTAIRWQTRGPYSHASIILDSGNVIEAREFKGVQMLKALQIKKGESVDVFRIDAPLPSKAKAIDWLLEKVREEAKYDWSSVFRFLTRRQESRSGSGKFFCSELAFIGVRLAGCDLLARVEPWAVDPNRLSNSPILVYEKTVSAP